MGVIRGIDQNYTTQNTPEGFGFFGKNLVGIKKLDALPNEKGTSIPASLAPLNPSFIHGEGKLSPYLIFCYKNTSNRDCIAIVNEDDNTVVEKINRNDLGFDIDHPIVDLRAKIGPNGRDLIIAFTDNYNTAKYINLTTATSLDSIDIYELFLKGKIPNIATSTLENSGVLSTGAVVFAIQYEDVNKSTSDWIILPKTTYVIGHSNNLNYLTSQGKASGTKSNKAIKVVLTELSTSFSKFNVAVITSNNDVVAAKKIKQVSYSSDTAIFVYTGGELETILTLNEVITENFIFNKVGVLGTLGNTLFAGDLAEEDVQDFQSIANTIQIKWVASKTGTITISSTSEEKDGNGSEKTFFPDEVYALYVQFEIGKKLSKWFHIPGRSLTLAEQSLVLGGPFPTNPKYQWEETTSITNIVTAGAYTTQAEGVMGAWKNKNEQYPANFPDLAGADVRHHRFPSLRYIKANTNFQGQQWGNTGIKLDIKVENINIPSEYQGVITGIRIGYAKRTEADKSVLGYDITQFNALQPSVASGIERLMSTGGNWSVKPDSSGSLSNITMSDQRYLRIHSPDILIDRPNITDIYIANQVKLTADNLQQESTPNDYHGTIYKIKTDPGGAGALVTNFITKGVASNVISNDKFKKLTKTKYIPQGVDFNDGTDFFRNIMGDEFAYGDVGEDLDLTTSSTVKLQEVDTSITEQVYLYSIKILKSDIFLDYANQTVIPATNIQKVVSNTISSFNITEGDSFVCINTLVTLGFDGNRATGVEFDEWGMRCMKVYLLPSRYNLSQRNQTLGDLSTYFFPTGAVTIEASPTVLGRFEYWWGNILQRSTNVNNIQISKDYSLQNEYYVQEIYDHNKEYQTDFQDLIIRSEESSKIAGISDGWRIFKPNNYFHTTRDRGSIINIEGVGNDSVIIHHGKGIFRTQGQVVLQSDITKISLGAGDIFDIAPKELSSAEYGYGGCQHKLCTIMCEAGYAYVDCERGEVFLYDFNKLELINKGFTNELYELLTNGVIGDNPYKGNGISFAFDKENYRLILSIRSTNSLTLSYDLRRQQWLCAHDYIPDRIFNTRKNLWSLKDNQLYKHNSGQRGVFYGVKYSSYFDFVFALNPLEEKVISSVGWITTVKSLIGELKPNETITHITIRSDYACTDRIPLTPQISLYDTESTNIKNTDDVWWFDKIINRVKASPTGPFISNIFNDYLPLSSQLDTDADLAWFDRTKFRGKYFIIRLEYDNSEDKEVYLQDVQASTRLSYK